MTVVGHVPVMVDEVIRWLRPRAGGCYVDCTVGDGGHALAILTSLQGKGTLIGIDRDETALERALATLADFHPHIHLVHAQFSDLGAVVAGMKLGGVDGILYDLGVSSLQLDSVSRGFSFRHSAPLDMRMDRDQSFTAEELVNTLPAPELERILREYGEERWAHRITEFLVSAREKQHIETTRDLVDVMARAVPAAVRHGNRIHFATRVFLALRIAVNDELGELEASLNEAARVLRPGGRMCVMAYHSVEDRLVKRCLRRKEPDDLRVLTKKVIRPCAEEVGANPRARSARMRVAERRGEEK